MSTDLKTCPFCGSTDVTAPVAYSRYDEKAVDVLCVNCGARGPARGVLAGLYVNARRFWWNDRAEAVVPPTALHAIAREYVEAADGYYAIEPKFNSSEEEFNDSAEKYKRLEAAELVLRDALRALAQDAPGNGQQPPSGAEETR